MKKLLIPLLFLFLAVTYSQETADVQKIIKKVNVYDICGDKDGITAGSVPRTSNASLVHSSNSPFTG
ncbi:MAG: hypothetical protein ACEPO8_11205 [Rhodothermaceae bacterium]